ncbi:hypothetical protein MS2017_0823 [Bathymodiolus thermophilus thioautotrophic gill symbiont]|uniref:Uncharacterized protein n=1 Tax=Bathymodiolus thermophilus thioautotrophic gill symbiont TaxID=2360 RepID=A0A3G3IL14_9GAMM|nr:hypothetical protein MS2017_0823 [Bathymodiolus thermophilus thioautotrophic gill symbiont]
MYKILFIVMLFFGGVFTLFSEYIVLPYSGVIIRDKFFIVSLGIFFILSSIYLMTIIKHERSLCKPTKKNR